MAMPPSYGEGLHGMSAGQPPVSAVPPAAPQHGGPPAYNNRHTEQQQRHEANAKREAMLGALKTSAVPLPSFMSSIGAVSSSPPSAAPASQPMLISVKNPETGEEETFLVMMPPDAGASGETSASSESFTPQPQQQEQPVAKMQVPPPSPPQQPQPQPQPFHSFRSFLLTAPTAPAIAGGPAVGTYQLLVRREKKQLFDALCDAANRILSAPDGLLTLCIVAQCPEELLRATDVAEVLDNFMKFATTSAASVQQVPVIGVKPAVNGQTEWRVSIEGLPVNSRNEAIRLGRLSVRGSDIVGGGSLSSLQYTQQMLGGTALAGVR